MELGENQVYFIVDDDSFAVKIGVAAFPEFRMEDIQVGNPHKLRLAKVIPNGNHKLEKELHRIFSDYTLGGEWFRLADEIKEFLGEKESQNEIHLDDEFRNFFPPLSDEQKAGLEQDVLTHGCLAPLILWNNILIDGYHRYDICQKLGIPFQTVHFKFDNKFEAMYWLLSHQKNRRNLSKYDLAVRALALRPILEKKAEERRQQAGELYHRGSPKVFLIQENLSIHTDKELAKLAGVSHDTIWKVERIEEKAPKELKEKCRKSEISINQAYVTVHRQEVKKGIKKAEWPTGRYRVIYADPPWQYSNHNPDYFTEQSDHYPTMPLTEIMALPVKDMALDDAVLFIWATSPILEDVFKVINAWGFKYKASFVWDKVKHNMGHYNSVRHEFLLVAVRGSCQPDNLKLFDSVQTVERMDHSAKPEVFRTIIDTLYPYGKRIELFARTKADGWEHYGNQIS